MDTADHELETLGSYLQAARAAAGLSFSQLAARTNIPTTTLHRLLHDEDRPAPKHLITLARALDCRGSDLFLLAGIPIPRDKPSLPVMLRTEYGLPPAAVAEAERQVQAIIEKYDRGS